MNVDETSAADYPRRLFGTSGIRGQMDGFLTPALAGRAGQAFAVLLQNRGSVLVGRDNRVDSAPIQRAFIRGLMAGAVDAIECGIVPTPALLFALKESRYSGGVMVTGSHAPAKTTGLLFFMADTGELDERGERQFEQLFWSKELKEPPRDEVRSPTTLNVLENYLEAVRRELRAISGYHVVVDPGNGSTCGILDRALEDAGCKVDTINGQPDGTFPSRSPYPQPSTLHQLGSTVKKMRADLGVGTDGDGDRAIFATHIGQVLWGDLTCAIFSEEELRTHNGGHIITTVNTSNIIRLLCHRYGGRLTVTKVGPPAMAQAIRDNLDALLATEESGKYIWPKVLMYGDAALATGRLIQIMKKKHKSLHELQSELPQFHLLKSNIPCPDELKERALEFAGRTLKVAENVDVSYLDGLKANYPNHSSILLRASGTEPVLRCYAESQELQEAKRLLEAVTTLAHTALSHAKEASTP